MHCSLGVDTFSCSFISIRQIVWFDPCGCLLLTTEPRQTMRLLRKANRRAGDRSSGVRVCVCMCVCSYL